jgi:hypothetical protein
MACGVRRVLAGSVVLFGLGALAACSSGGFFGAREPWRKEAESRCLDSGAVKQGPGVVRIAAINGPGMCGADFPLRVTMLGEPGAIGFGDEMRPPAAIPGAAPPRWPIVEPGEPPRARAVDTRPLPPLPPTDYSPAPPPPRDYSATPQQRVVTPWRPDQPPFDRPSDGPISLDPPNAAAAPPDMYDYRAPHGAAPSRAPGPMPPPRAARVDTSIYDLSPDPRTRRLAPPSQPLGPVRGPRVAGTTGTVTVQPAATLACPMVAVLDQWIASSVQPAAMHWFGQPVVEIRQISAYSCRGMNGNPSASISEHAFGNALDIASFTLADGRRVTVRDGWRGTPEEQGFLRDVQGAACDRFTTVLAPGSNRFHYDHMHVDLMRRNGRACNPRAVSGEEVAARARAHYAQQGRDPSVTGSVGSRRKGPPPAFAEDKIGHQLPLAIPGEDGED